MKIAMIGQKGIPAGAGGVEQHVERLACELASRGHDVVVYCRRSYCAESGSASPPVTSEAADRGGRVHGVFRPSIPTKHLDAITHTAICTLDVLLRDVDLVHYHAIGPALLSPIARLRGLPTVVTVHGLDWQRAKWGRVAKLCLRAGERVAADTASRLVVVSETLRDYFRQTYGCEATFIPNGVAPIERRRPDRIKQWGLRPGRYVLAVSRLVREKGLHYLIPAFQRLDTDLQLVIAGGGGLDESYENELRRMAGPRVVFTGNADRTLLAELYSNALLFVLPSELEGMSIALLEAMSCGVPSVVSDITENVCVIGDDGFTFRDRDTEHLSRVLESVLACPELLPAFAERCRNRAERYRWPQVAAELEAVYYAALGVAPPAPPDDPAEAVSPVMRSTYSAVARTAARVAVAPTEVGL
jgi:glycosyltransferase involved in cell wall biosynthesis